MRLRFGLGACVAVLLGSMGCSNIDCPLDNVVMMQCNIYASETGLPLKLTDTLTVRAAGRDTILLNRATDINSFLLPLKEGGTCDTLLLRLSNAKGQVAVDTLFVEHESHLHFESLDCPASFFHTLKRVRATSHPLSQLPLTVDSVSLVRSTVNYDDIENLRIFLRATSDH